MRSDKVRDAIEKSIKEVIKELEVKDSVREEVIKLGRDVIRESGYVITSLHSGDVDEAYKHKKNMEKVFKSVWALTSKFPELRYSGLMNNIASEFVEAEVFYELVTEGKIPSIDEVGVTSVQYVQGILDVVGELKRFVLDRLRRGNLAEAENFFRVAEAFYELAKTLDFPEPILPGVRRKVDIARSLIESMRTLITDFRSRLELVRAVEEAKKIMKK